MHVDELETGIREKLSLHAADGTCGQTLYRVASGIASPDEVERFNRHRAHCPDCREDLNTYFLATQFTLSYQPNGENGKRNQTQDPLLTKISAMLNFHIPLVAL